MICRLCPRECGAQRTEQRGSGFCGMPVGIRVARAALHRWEEPPISGTNGSGAVFFSGCTLRCCYCQNHAISAEGFGKDVTPQRLRAIFEELIAQGAHNIDLITATHFLPWILPALEPKLPVPLVYNCGGYEKVETLRRLEGLVDIWLPDMKYADGGLAAELSAAPDYFPVAAAAIQEMFRQTGPYVIENGLLRRGHPPSGAAGISGQQPPRHGLGGPDVPARGRAVLADEPVYPPARRTGASGPPRHPRRVPRRRGVHAQLRYCGRIHPGADGGEGGIYAAI